MRKQLEALVYDAGKLILDGYASVETKGSVSNMVTNMDKAVEDFLVDGLKKLFRDINFICEEEDLVSGAKQCEFTAVIDPIDGTSNFVRGMNLSAISVAILRHGKAFLAVVHLPYTNEMFSAQAGCGATLNGQPIHVSERPLKASCFATAWSLYDKSLAQPCFDICQSVYSDIDDFRRLGAAALELVYLAAGRCELYFEIRLYPWDFAAASLIIEEAGGYWAQLGAENGDYSHPSGFVAANSRASFEYLMEKIHQHLPEGIFQRDAYRSLY
jgi:myo-inositol-1(or 4)-monophosphatase